MLLDAIAPYLDMQCTCIKMQSSADPFISSDRLQAQRAARVAFFLNLRKPELDKSEIKY